MAKVTVKFNGASSSGRSFEYTVNNTDKTALEADGVVFSTVSGRENSFYSPTNLHSTKNTIGATAEVDVRSYTPSGSSRAVNFFHGINKAVQKAFVKKLRDMELLDRMKLGMENGVDALALFQADKLMKEMALLDAQISRFSAQ